MTHGTVNKPSIIFPIILGFNILLHRLLLFKFTSMCIRLKTSQSTKLCGKFYYSFLKKIKQKYSKELQLSTVFTENYKKCCHLRHEHNTDVSELRIRELFVKFFELLIVKTLQRVLILKTVLVSLMY